MRNQGPSQTRTNKISKISDQDGPIGPRTRRFLDPWFEHRFLVFVGHHIGYVVFGTGINFGPGFNFGPELNFGPGTKM